MFDALQPDAVSDVMPAAPDHAARVAEEVARRYGLPVSPDVVQIVRAGASGFEYPVWGEVAGRARLRGAAGLKAGSCWQRNREAGRRMQARQQRFARAAECSAPVQARRDLVAALHGAGKSDLEMADAIGCSVGTVIQDRGKLGLAVNRSLASHVVLAQARAKTALDLLAGGATVAQAAAAVGVTPDHLRRLVPKEQRAFVRPELCRGRRMRLVEKMGRDGATLAQIKAAVPLSRTRILAVLAQAGIAPPPEPAPGPLCPYAADRQRIAARRAQIAALVADGMGLIEVWLTVRPRAGAFRSDCIALGYGWPLAGLARVVAQAKVTRQSARRRAVTAMEAAG